jgi:hypothetical protein
MDLAANEGRVHVIRAVGFPMSLCCRAPLYISGVVAISRSIVVRSDQDNRRAAPPVRVNLEGAMTKMIKESARKLAAFKIFLRVYGVLTLIIFSLLFVGVLVETPLLSEHGGALNWTIWNDVRFGNEHNHVPPMLMIIYIVWGVFLIRAARNPQAYLSFLSFTMWANLAHGVLMAGQAGMDIDRYWSKFFTDIPFVLILALGIYLLRPTADSQQSSADVRVRTVAQHDS